MRDDLDCTAEVIAPTLFLDFIGIDFTGRETVVPVHTGPDKTLIMTKIKVRLGTVLGHINLTMLERTHRTRIHVDIGIQLQQGDLQTAGLQDCAKGSRGNTLAQRRNYTTCDKYKTCHAQSDR